MRVAPRVFLCCLIQKTSGGNLFVIIEGNNSPDDNSMQLKLKYGNNWADFTGSNGMERLPDMYGTWRHLAFTYDETTSTLAVYLDGEALSLPEAVSHPKVDGAPLGPLGFHNRSVEHTSELQTLMRIP